MFDLSLENSFNNNNNNNNTIINSSINNKFKDTIDRK